MQCIGDAAKALMNKELLAQKEKLQKDYLHYLDQPNPENCKQVEKDIKDFEGILG
jgi:hypothetical protein